jgi:phosphatidate cytidylyltransferase
VLRQRVLTALVLAPPLVWGILYLPSPIVTLFLGLFILLGAWEWPTLAGVDSQVGRAGFVATVGALLALVWSLTASGPWSAGAMAVAGAWWVGVLFWVLRHTTGTLPPASAWPLGSRITAGLVTLVPAWWALVWLHSSERYGPSMVLFVLMLVWAADIGAFFAGRRWGSRRLAPAISPGKTLEGALGALVATAVFSLAAGAWWGLAGTGLAVFTVLSLITVIFSILGDLFESVLKRQANVKDSGQLLPGHGGVLDRIDSVTAAAPVFVAGLMVTGVAP